MATTTVRPSGDAFIKNWLHEGAGATLLYQHVDDDPVNDATFIASQANYPSAHYLARFGDITVTAQQRVKAARIRYRRSSHTNGVPENVYADFQDTLVGGIVTGENSSTASTTWVEKVGGWRTVAPNGHEWTQATANSVGMRLYSKSGGWARISELYIDFDIRNQATVSGVTVTGNTTSSRPTVSWTFTANADGDPQAIYQLKIFTSSQYGAAGFDPDTANADGGQGDWTSATSVELSSDLLNGTTYKVYVAAGVVFNDDVWYSTYVPSAAFTVSLGTLPPPAPTLAVTADETLPRLRTQLTVVGNLNALTAHQASVEADTFGWTSISNCTLARSAAQFADGANSLAMTASSTATMTAGLAGALRVPVKAGSTYTMRASFRAATTGRTVRSEIAWLTAAGAAISTSSASGSTDTTGGWTASSVTAVAPATAALAQPQLTVVSAANTEVHYADQISLHPGSSTSWTPGGYLPGQASANLLSANQASLEAGTTGWAATVNCALSQSTAQALDGAASLGMTSVAGGSMTASTPTGTGGFPVAANQTYTALAAARAATAGRTVNLTIGWYDAGGSSISSSTGAGTDITGGWSLLSVTAAAPTTAVYAALTVTVVSTGGASELHYVDKLSLAAGSSTSWLAPGTVPATTTTVEYADLTTGLLNYANPQLASGTDTLTTTDGFFPRIAADTVASDPTASVSGQRSLRWDLTSASSFLDIGFLAGVGAAGTDYGLPVVPSQPMVFSLYLKATAAAVVRLWISPRTIADADGGGETSTDVTVSTTWQRYWVSTTPGAAGLWARAGLNIPAGTTGVSVWADGLQWELGTTANPLADGQGHPPSWTTARDAAALQLNTADQTQAVYDEEAAPGIPRMYRATTVTSPAGPSITGVSAYAVGYLDPPGSWLLKDPLDPTRSMELLVTELTEQVVEDAQEFHPLGRARPVVLGDWIGGVDGQLTAATLDARTWQQLEALVRSQRTLLLFFPDGAHRYVRFRERSWPRAGSSGGWQRQVGLPFLETSRPT